MPSAVHHLVGGVAVGADDVGDLGGCHPEAQREIEHLAVSLAQCLGGAPHQVGDLVVLRRARRIVGRRHTVLDAEPGRRRARRGAVRSIMAIVSGSPGVLRARAPEMIERPVARDAQQPAAEHLGPVERGELLPRSQERVLRHVGRRRRVTA